MKRVRVGCWALLAVVTVVGSWLETPPAPDVHERGGFRVLRSDFHVHTRFSDGVLSPPEVVLTAQRRGLDVIAVTEHNTVMPAKLARAYSEWTNGPRVLVGEEITTGSFHLIGVGLTETIDAHGSVREIAGQIREQGGVSIAAHPTESSWPSFDPARDALDAAEVVHPVAIRKGQRGFKWSDMVEFFERAERDQVPLTAIGSSDYHFFRTMGLTHTLVFARDNSEQEVLAALRDGRTVVIAPDGQVFGDPELARLVADDPLPIPLSSEGYESKSVRASITRTAAFFLVLGLFGTRKERFKA